MPTFKTKPVLVEAEQFTEEIALAYLCDNKLGPFDMVVGGKFTPKERTLIYATGRVRDPNTRNALCVDIGDWIVKDRDGNLSIVEPEVFHAVYEPVENSNLKQA